MNAKFPLLDNPKVLCVDDEPNILEGLSAIWVVAFE